MDKKKDNISKWIEKKDPKPNKETHPWKAPFSTKRAAEQKETLSKKINKALL